MFRGDGFGRFGRCHVQQGVERIDQGALGRGTGEHAGVQVSQVMRADDHEHPHMLQILRALLLHEVVGVGDLRLEQDDGRGQPIDATRTDLDQGGIQQVARAESIDRAQHLDAHLSAVGNVLGQQRDGHLPRDAIILDLPALRENVGFQGGALAKQIGILAQEGAMLIQIATAIAVDFRPEIDGLSADDGRPVNVENTS